MSGKLFGSGLMIIAIVLGALLYYTQVYYFYEPVTGPQVVRLTALATDMPEEIIADDVEAIDASSSPIRYRACFTTSMGHGLLTETYVLYEGATPLTAPDWFACFDANAIGASLEDGSALAFLGEKNIDYGVDEIVAITEDGRGYVWHQLNDCGRKAYDGTPVGPECPARETIPAAPESE